MLMLGSVGKRESMCAMNLAHIQQLGGYRWKADNEYPDRKAS